jgi:cytochrome c oxidase subunit 2
MTVRSVLSAALLLALAQPPAGGAPAQSTSAPGAAQTVKLTARKYDFEPATLTVTRGQPVRIEATALDRDHGIEIKEFGVKTKLEKGKVAVIEFTPDRTGEFSFHCSVFCGLGHRGMKGKLIVVEPPAG